MSVHVCMLLGVMGLKKMGERLCLSKSVPDIVWKELISKGDYTEVDRLGNLRAQHAEFAVSLPSS